MNNNAAAWNYTLHDPLPYHPIERPYMFENKFNAAGNEMAVITHEKETPRYASICLFCIW